MPVLKCALISMTIFSNAFQQMETPYSEKMLRDKISYYDRSSGYFIAVSDDRSEYMVGTVLEKLSEGDVPVNRGKIQICSTLQFTCKKVGPYLFLNPGRNFISGSFVNINGYRAKISKMPSNRYMVEVRCEKFAATSCLQGKTKSKPDLIYQYEVGVKGDIAKIAIKWNIGSTYSYNLRPVSLKFLVE